jgi:8-oxo-dGTP pyrophosphatase MutT (NUDIX family)
MDLDTIRKNLAPVSGADIASGNFTPAAVLFPLLKKKSEINVLFTKRTQTVRAHKGQISFPGGVRDEGDESLLATALREADEEIGLRPHDVEIVGGLDAVETVTSGFVIHTFIGLIPYPYPFRLSSQEVAELLIVPIDFLADPAKWSHLYADTDHGASGTSYVSYGDHVIWGATARILKSFFQRNGIDVGKKGD